MYSEVGFPKKGVFGPLHIAEEVKFGPVGKEGLRLAADGPKGFVWDSADRERTKRSRLTRRMKAVNPLLIHLYHNPDKSSKGKIDRNRRE